MDKWAEAYYRGQVRDKIGIFKSRGFIVENMSQMWIEDLLGFGVAKEQATKLVNEELGNGIY